MLKRVYFVGLITLACACGQGRERFSIESFNKLPSEVENGGCYFAETETKFDSGVYIFVQSYYDSTAYLTIDGECVQFKCTHSEVNERTLDFNETFVGSGYKLSISMKCFNSRDSLHNNLYSGEMMIENKKGKISKGLYGMCGDVEVMDN